MREGRLIGRIVTQPALYSAWALLVVASLIVGYFLDPYIFAFTALFLLWATGAVGVLGLAVCVAATSLAGRSKVAILSSITLAAVALGLAVAILGTFKWA